MKTNRGLIASFVITFGLLLGGARALARSKVNNPAACLTGSLAGNTTWSVGQSPYTVCSASLAIPVGSKLTIDPGVTVKFQANGSLSIAGELIALGTAAQPITMTSDLPATKWNGISVSANPAAPARANFGYTQIDYGGNSGTFGAAIYVDQGAITVTHTTIQNGAGNGILVTYQGLANIQASSFFNNARSAIELDAPKSSLINTGLTAANNGANGHGDGILISGVTTVHGSRRWVDAGIPYLIDRSVSNAYGDDLTIEPGARVEFTGTATLSIGGVLNAIGSPAKPITFTGETQRAGIWRGIVIYGGSQKALAQMDYVTVEYGGNDIRGANIEVGNGQLIAHHTIVRYSQKDGVLFDSGSNGTMLESQIYSNTLYGMNNAASATQVVLATNNWWGAPDGPQTQTPACGTGSGSLVTDGVIFRPVLTGTHSTSAFPLSAAPVVTLSPRRWFAPADAVTRVYFDILVQDGNGAPLPGRKVRLKSSLGSPVDGGITDLQGKTLAYLTSASVGDAQVTAVLDNLTCEYSLSPAARVTFTSPLVVKDLFPNAAAPYFSKEITLSPLPVTTGVTTTIHATLTNPFTLPVTVDVSFGFVQSSIGLAFGPIKDIPGVVIPPGGTTTLDASWRPNVSGHYCVEVSYNLVQIGLLARQGPNAPTNSNKDDLNINSRQGPMNQPHSKDSLEKADKAFNLVSKVPAGPTQIQRGMISEWWGAISDAASKASKALGFDPPRLDYNITTTPVRHPIPPFVPTISLPPERVAALNAINDALVDVEAYGTAATVALDRYGGASEALDLAWASEQSNEMVYYQEKFANALLTFADRLDAFVALLRTEGETGTVVSLTDVLNYQNRLKNSGFTPQELNMAQAIGLSSADIDAYLQNILAADPNDLAGDLLVKYTNLAAQARDTANNLLHPNNFYPGGSVGGTAGLAPQAVGNSMAQVYNSTDTVLVTNPFTSTQAVNMQTRLLEFPADWGLTVSPSQFVLGPKGQMQVTVTIVPGSLQPQGSVPKFAIEGYTGSQLLGGIVIQMVVPQYKNFSGKVPLFLPLIDK